MMSRKFISIAVAVLIAFSMMPAAYASAGHEKSPEEKRHEKAVEKAISELSSQLQDKTRDPYDYVGGAGGLKLNAGEYPEQYDLRSVDTDNDGIGDTSYVTPVKFQNPFGSCWGFAAIAAAESSILSNKDLNDDGTGKPLYSISPSQATSQDGKTDADGNTILDLSEKHVVYFAMTALDDPDDPQNGEGMQFLYPTNASGRMDNGGTPFVATSLFSSGMGPNLTDRKYPYSSGRDDDMTDILAYKGKNGEIETRKIDGNWDNFCYSPDDDWGIDEEYRFLQSFKLKESYLLPSPAKEVVNNPDDPFSDTHYEYDPDGTRAIKKQLMEGRAVQVGFLADTSSPDPVTNEATYINENTWAHYVDDSTGANHAVTIVGWDDNYSAENYVKDHRPPQDLFPDGKVEGATNGGNGAWLVKNSWGTGERSFPNRGNGDWGLLNEKGEHTGYFWLSYYDRTISLPEALAFDKSNVGSEYYLDQHDFMPVTDAASATTTVSLSTANMFQAAQAETLEQVSCQTAIPDTHVKYDVYLLTEYHRDPTDGIKVASEEADYELGGFHKITLKEPVLIQKGQYYSIVVTQTVPDGSYAYSLQSGIGKDLAIFANLRYYEAGIINREESYASIDGQWFDLGDSNILEQLAGEDYGIMSYDNFPIKGYCAKADSTAVTNIAGDRALSLVPGDETCDLKLRLRGASITSDPVITWKVPEGYEDLLSVSPKDDTTSCDAATVTAKAYGIGFVTVEVEGVGTTVVSIVILKHGIGYPYYKDLISEFEYTGEPIIPEFTIRCNDGCGELTEGVHYKVTYVDNVNAGEATVIVEGLGDHEGTVRDTFTILKAANRLKVSGRSTTVKASSLRNKAATVKRSKVIKTSGADGKVTYAKKKGSKKITVNKKNGNLKLAKGLKKGKYKVQILVKAKGDKNHKKASKKVTAVIRVK